MSGITWRKIDSAGNDYYDCCIPLPEYSTALELIPVFTILIPKSKQMAQVVVGREFIPFDLVQQDGTLQLDHNHTTASILNALVEAVQMRDPCSTVQDQKVLIAKKDLPLTRYHVQWMKGDESSTQCMLVLHTDQYVQIVTGHSRSHVVQQVKYDMNSFQDIQVEDDHVLVLTFLDKSTESFYVENPNEVIHQLKLYSGSARLVKDIGIMDAEDPIAASAEAAVKMSRKVYHKIGKVASAFSSFFTGTTDSAELEAILHQQNIFYQDPSVRKANTIHSMYQSILHNDSSDARTLEEYAKFTSNTLTKAYLSTKGSSQKRKCK